MQFLKDNEILNNTLLFFAVLRVYLEVIGKTPSSFPLSKKIAHYHGPDKIEKFHRSGLYLAIGFILLFLPVLFFN